MATNFRLGLFIVATLLILAAGIFLIGSNQSLFKSTYEVRAGFHNVAGLNNGAEVRVGGIHAGTVRRIELPGQPEGDLTVVMDLQKSTRDLVKKDSVASIRSEGLLGDRYVEVSFGSNDARKLGDNEFIRGEPPLEMSALVKKADEILDTTKAAVENVQESTGNLRDISAKINQGQGTVGALINDKKIYKEASKATTALQEDMEALKHNFFLRGFFKDRGYEDSSELAKYQIQRLPSEPPVQSFSYDEKKLFDKPDTAKLKNEKSLNEAGKFLEHQNFRLAVVTASTGLKGDSDKNLTLTQARAYVVRKYLVEHFRFDDTHLKTLGLGETEDPQAGGKLEIVVYSDSEKSP
jgi:phospholipid/cholesterol/gamma-HCH transport system substrate-binding protein